MPIQSMQQKYGVLRQLAFVPRDFDAALRYWTDVVGVGPFFYFEHIPLVDACYRGHRIELDCSAALSFWGDLEIELLRQHDNRPSAFREWLDAGHEGVHHLRLDCDDLEVARRYCTESAGGEIVQEACMPGGRSLLPGAAARIGTARGVCGADRAIPRSLCPDQARCAIVGRQGADSNPVRLTVREAHMRGGLR